MRDSNNNSSKPSSSGGKSISIANIIAVVGLVVLAFFLYLGFSYGGTNSSTAVIYSVGLTAVMAVLLFLLLYAKKQDNDLKKWRIVEGILVVVFIAACALMTPILCKFFNVNANSARLQECALEDINSLENVRDEFQSFEKNKLSQMSLQLQTLVNKSRDSNVDFTTQELDEFISDEISGESCGKINNSNVDAFVRKWNSYIDSIYYPEELESYYSKFEDAMDRNRNRIQSWNLLDVPQAIQDIDALCRELGNDLTKISNTYPLHRIGKSGSQYDIIEKHTAFVTTITPTLKDEIDKVNGLTPAGVITSLIIFFLIFFNYLVAYRSSRVAIKAGSAMHDGGILLK